jgi:hypothetical protein
VEEEDAESESPVPAAAAAAAAPVPRVGAPAMDDCSALLLPPLGPVLVLRLGLTPSTVMLGLAFFPPLGQMCEGGGGLFRLRCWGRVFVVVGAERQT